MPTYRSVRMKKISDTQTFSEIPIINLALRAVYSALKKIKARPKFSLNGVCYNMIISNGREVYMEISTQKGSRLHVRCQFATEGDRGKLFITIFSNTEHNLCADINGRFEFSWSARGRLWQNAEGVNYRRVYVRRCFN